MPIAKDEKLCYNKGAKEKEVQSNEKLSLDVLAGRSEKKIKRFGREKQNIAAGLLRRRMF